MDTNTSQKGRAIDTYLRKLKRRFYTLQVVILSIICKYGSKKDCCMLLLSISQTYFWCLLPFTAELEELLGFTVSLEVENSKTPEFKSPLG